jgi:hypothetical protein
VIRLSARHVFGIPLREENRGAGGRASALRQTQDPASPLPGVRGARPSALPDFKDKEIRSSDSTQYEQAQIRGLIPISGWPVSRNVDWLLERNGGVGYS